MVKRSKIISLMKRQRGGRTSFVSELWDECVLRGPWAWVWTGSMCVWESQLWSMRIDLVRGQERCSATATEAAEIDFMNIKQQGVDTGTRLLQSTQGHAMVALYLCGYTEKDIFFAGYPDIWNSNWYSNTVIDSHNEYFSLKNEVGHELSITQSVSKLRTHRRYPHPVHPTSSPLLLTSWMVRWESVVNKWISRQSVFTVQCDLS